MNKKGFNLRSRKSVPFSVNGPLNINILFAFSVHIRPYLFRFHYSRRNIFKFVLKLLFL